MPKLHITPANYPGVPRCSRCDNSFQDGCFRVQRKTSNPKRWATIGWICSGCAEHHSAIDLERAAKP